jgi:hypothetical protein
MKVFPDFGILFFSPLSSLSSSAFVDLTSNNRQLKRTSILFYRIMSDNKNADKLALLTVGLVFIRQFFSSVIRINIMVSWLFSYFCLLCSVSLKILFH